MNECEIDSDRGTVAGGRRATAAALKAFSRTHPKDEIVLGQEFNIIFSFHCCGCAVDVVFDVVVVASSISFRFSLFCSGSNNNSVH